uniref:Uncharacterized protein n=1 Tax=Setaria italica TaxID=4555 RepID=K3YX06_SETIT
MDSLGLIFTAIGEEGVGLGSLGFGAACRSSGINWRLQLAEGSPASVVVVVVGVAGPACLSRSGCDLPPPSPHASLTMDQETTAPRAMATARATRTRRPRCRT